MNNSILDAVNKTESVEDIEALSGLLEMTYSSSDATQVAPPNSENIIASNMAAQAAQIGTIGPTPWHETDEGAETLLNLAIGSAGGGIGASIRGGKPLNLFAGYPKQSQSIIKKWLKGLDDIDEIEEGKQIARNIAFKNKLSKAKIQNQKTLEKYKIDDPDFEEYVSPLNYLLDAVRNLKRN